MTPTHPRPAPAGAPTPRSDGWRGRRRRGGGDAVAASVLMALRPPVEAILTGALRRLARRRPDLFDRLGACRRADIVVAPTDFPVSFRLRPDGARGAVRVARRDDAAPCAARITGPLLTLLDLFDGGGDADSAFFSRRIRIEGDTAAVVALHNTLEAGELTLADLLGLPPSLARPVNAGLAHGLTRLRAWSAAA